MASMGQTFIAAREKKNMTLSRAAQLTRIKVQHLERMEADDFSEMPAPTYAKGFIRIYSEVLGIDPEPLVQEYIDRHLGRAPDPASKPSAVRPAARPKKKPPAPRRDTGDGGGSKSLAAAAARVAAALAPLRKRLGELAPGVTKLALALVTVLLLVGMVRCAVRLGAGDETAPAGTVHLDERAIMKEPPVRYLDVPEMKEEQP